MKKVSMYLMVTAMIIVAGTAFIAHSWNQGGRGLLGGITGGVTDVTAAAVDVPQKLVTGEEMTLDERGRGALGTVVGGAGDVVAATVDVPENVVRGGRGRGYGRRYEDDYIETEIDADSDDYEEEISDIIEEEMPEED